MKSLNHSYVAIIITAIIVFGLILTACTSSSLLSMDDMFGFSDEEESQPAGVEEAQSTGVHLPPEGAVAMSTPRFQELKEQVDNQAMSERQLEVISHAAKTNYFTSDQVADLVEMMDMAEGRISVVASTSPRILDLNNSYIILDRMTFQDESNEAQSILQSVEQERQQERERIAAAERDEEQAAIEDASDAKAEDDDEGSSRRRSLRGRVLGGGSSSDDSSSDDGETMRCCINGQYYSCPDRSSSRKCFPPRLASCIGRCIMSGDMGCEMDCIDEYPPDPSDCDRAPMRDNECD